jgi:hypothetical protein
VSPKTRRPPALEQGAEWNARVRRRGRDVGTIPHTTYGRVAFASSGRSLARARVRTGSRFTSEQNRSHNRTEQNAPSMGLRWTLKGASEGACRDGRAVSFSLVSDAMFDASFASLDHDAQLLELYLRCCRHRSTEGLFRLPVG